MPELTVHQYQCGHLGTPLALVSGKGAIDWQIRLDPWGNAIDEQNTHNLYQPIRMQGQHFDPKSGMHYNRYRYYDPKIGRYVTQDSISLEGGINVYVYPNDPNTWVDPGGLWSDMPIFNGAGVREYASLAAHNASTPIGPTTAEACYRPLQGFPFAVIGIELDKQLNTFIGHEHIFFPDGTHVGYGPQGIFDQNEDRSNYSSCEPLGATKEEVMEAVANLKRSGEFEPSDYGIHPRWLGGNNCQDFVDAVRRSISGNTKK